MLMKSKKTLSRYKPYLHQVMGTLHSPELNRMSKIYRDWHQNLDIPY